MTGDAAVPSEDRSIRGRLQRILGSGDRHAIAVVENAILTAELLLDRRRLSRMPRIKAGMSKDEIAALAKRVTETGFKARPRGLRTTPVLKGEHRNR